MENQPNEIIPADWYENGYRNCYYTGLLGLVYGLVHKIIERPFRREEYFEKVLEVGAGNGEHYDFVKHDFSLYFMTDISLPSFPKSSQDLRIVVKQMDCANLIEFGENSIDRLIATCLLAHLDSPFKALMEWKRVVKPGGIISLYLPSEPGMLLRFVRKFFIWPKSKRNGSLNPKFHTYSEHRNHYPGMISLVETVFSGDKIRRSRYPLRILGWNFSLFEILQIELVEN